MSLLGVERDRRAGRVIWQNNKPQRLFGTWPISRFAYSQAAIAYLSGATSVAS